MVGSDHVAHEVSMYTLFKTVPLNSMAFRRMGKGELPGTS